MPQRVAAQRSPCPRVLRHTRPMRQGPLALMLIPCFVAHDLIRYRRIGTNCGAGNRCGRGPGGYSALRLDPRRQLLRSDLESTDRRAAKRAGVFAGAVRPVGERLFRPREEGRLSRWRGAGRTRVRQFVPSSGEAWFTCSRRCTSRQWCCGRRIRACVSSSRSCRSTSATACSAFAGSTLLRHGRWAARNAVLVVFLVAVLVSYASRYSTLQLGPLPEGIAKTESRELFEFVKYQPLIRTMSLYSAGRARWPS